MSDEPKITTGTKIEAFLCKICPVCVISRQWPRSRFAAKVREMESKCRFCKAYEKVKGS